MNQTTSVNSCSHELLYYGNPVIIAILFSHSHCVYVRQFLPISSTLVAILWPFSIPPFLILPTKLRLLSCLSNEGNQSSVSITWGLFEWLEKYLRWVTVLEPREYFATKCRTQSRTQLQLRFSSIFHNRVDSLLFLPPWKQYERGRKPNTMVGLGRLISVHVQVSQGKSCLPLQNCYVILCFIFSNVSQTQYLTVWLPYKFNHLHQET